MVEVYIKNSFNIDYHHSRQIQQMHIENEKGKTMRGV